MIHDVSPSSGFAVMMNLFPTVPVQHPFVPSEKQEAYEGVLQI